MLVGILLFFISTNFGAVVQHLLHPDYGRKKPTLFRRCNMAGRWISRPINLWPCHGWITNKSDRARLHSAIFKGGCTLRKPKNNTQPFKQPRRWQLVEKEIKETLCKCLTHRGIRIIYASKIWGLRWPLSLAGGNMYHMNLHLLHAQVRPAKPHRFRNCEKWLKVLYL